MKISPMFLSLIACVALSTLATSPVSAGVPESGFKSLFIGHSFFRPFADAMPDYVSAAGIPGHTQTVVFAGGANGAPQALWLNAAKSADIKAVLDGGDIELFAMTYHPNYPAIDGYVNWLNYALARNPNTRFALALPWSPYPATTNAASYAATWLDAQATGWHAMLDTLRGLYPGVDIFSIPYGQSAVELRLLFADGNLPDVQNLQGSASTSIYRDNLGHAGDILVDLGRLVWLNALYDVDLSNYSYGPGYTTDLHALATAIMDGHNTQYDAAYHIDADGDKVGDALDNCPLVANPDQIPSATDPDRGVACDDLPPGC